MAWLLSLFILQFSLASCGFHLRGTGSIDLPVWLSALEVRVQGNTLENYPLRVAMRDALRTQTSVRLDEPGAPRLVLFDERSDSRVLSVTSTVRVEEYVLTYAVSFRIEDPDGRVRSVPQTVQVRRDHQFDRLNVLAKEREEQDLRREMQRDAVQQILRRLAHVTPLQPHADQR